MQIKLQPGMNLVTRVVVLRKDMQKIEDPFMC